ncbi:MAG: nucleotidyltransferase domain-containing protein [Deltaproteobacteria bacterium]|nr:nucleotidyltransferase domain-containing protein [Deltaproteobacteria bacterium]
MTELDVALKSHFDSMDDIHIVILFGSRASGNATEKSDVDVAVYFSDPLTSERKMRLITELSNLCNAEIDLLDLHDTGALIFRQVLSKGRFLVNRTPAVYEKLLKRLVYDEADFLPLLRRTLRERANRFIDGQ